MNAKTPTTIKLIGDIEENFYQLGLKDSDSFQHIYNHFFKFSLTSNESINTMINFGSKSFARILLKRFPQFSKKVMAYAQGLNKPIEDIAQMFLFPELLNSFEKWLPSLPQALFGCSSLISVNQEGETIHGRVLDYPLVGSFDRFERSLLMKFKGFPQMWSLGSSGMPFPALTVMCEHGMTLALHQKFGPRFHPKGTPIFEIVLNLLQNCDSPREIMRFLKTTTTLSQWGLYMTFPEGKALAVDLNGEQLYKKEFQLDQNQTLYFNNLPLQGQLENQFPPGLQNYCSMRANVVKNRLSKYEKKGPLRPLDHLKILGSPQIKKSTNAAEWSLSPATFSSVHIVSMVGKKNNVNIIPGPAPKILGPQYIQISDLWNSYDELLKSSGQKHQDPNYLSASHHFAMAGAEYDQNEFQKAHHHIQMSSAKFKGYPESLIANFYYLVFDYLHVSNTKDYKNLSVNFHQLYQQLPEYLNDHLILFILRVDKILETTITVDINEIQNKQLLKIAKLESKLSSFWIKKLRSMIIPRLDMIDIFYCYQDILELPENKLTELIKNFNLPSF